MPYPLLLHFTYSRIARTNRVNQVPVICHRLLHSLRRPDKRLSLRPPLEACPIIKQQKKKTQNESGRGRNREIKRERERTTTEKNAVLHQKHTCALLAQAKRTGKADSQSRHSYTSPQSNCHRRFVLFLVGSATVALNNIYIYTKAHVQFI